MRRNERLGRRALTLLLVMALLVGSFVALPTSAEEEENLFAKENWKMGTYANSSAQSRRHIVIPCELGEIYLLF